MKKIAPSVAAVLYLYSEDQLEVFDVFETTDLNRFVNTDGQVDVTRVLGRDIQARIGWIEIADTEQRKHLYKRLSQHFSAQGRIDSTRETTG
jgi:hypothetical protein